MVNEAGESDLLRWIPLLPLLAATYHGVAIGVVRRSTPPAMTAAISCGAVCTSFVLACFALGDLLALPADSRLLVDDVYTWIGAGVGSSAMSAEVAVGLGILLSMFRNRDSVNVEEVNLLKW